MSKWQVEITVGGIESSNNEEYDQKVRKIEEVIVEQGFTVNHIGIGEEDDDE